MTAIRSLVFVSAMGASLCAWAGATVEASGYLDTRATFTRSRTWGLLPTDDQPQGQVWVELNLQTKVLPKEHSFGYVDVSLLGNYSDFYRGIRDGKEVELEAKQRASAQPVVSLNEVYYSHEVSPKFHVLAGKKRTTWGAGLAYNPTDLLNPRRDPTDPTFQRAGAWLAQVEVPLESMTFSLQFAPTVMAQQSGIPTHFMYWPKWNEKDTQPHFQMAARWYALLAETDVNLMMFYENKSIDAFRDKMRLGVSASRYFFKDYEFHLEALVQQGSPRSMVAGECVDSLKATGACLAKSGSIFNEEGLSDKTVRPRILVGSRRQFDDESLLSVEYLFQADGWSKENYGHFVSALTLVRDASFANVPLDFAALSAPSADGLPTRFSFDPRGRHYLFLSYQKPRIRDDFTFQVVVVANLEDLSSLVTPSLTWSATEWLSLMLYGFLPLPGPEQLAIVARDGTRFSEFGSTPFAGRVMFEARAFF